MMRTLSWIVCANVYDFVATAMLLAMGLVIELNPVMDAAWSVHPVVFGIAKLGGTLAFVSLVWAYRDLRSARRAAAIVGVVYAGVALWQTAGIGLLVWRWL